MRVLRVGAIRLNDPHPIQMEVVGDGEVRRWSRRDIRFGPEPEPQAAQTMRALQQGKELARMIRETIARMRKPLWFWEV